MKRSDLEDLIESTFETVKKINGSKGREYADDEEALANFYHRGEEFGIDPVVVAGIFLSKHLDAIKAFVRTGDVRSEPIEGRVHDAILYLILLLGLVEDRHRDEQAIVEHAGENQLALVTEEDLLGPDKVRTLDELREKFTPATPPDAPIGEALQAAIASRPEVDDGYRVDFDRLLDDPARLPAVDHGPVWTEEHFRQRAAEDGVPTLGEGAA